LSVSVYLALFEKQYKGECVDSELLADLMIKVTVGAPNLVLLMDDIAELEPILHMIPALIAFSRHEK